MRILGGLNSMDAETRGNTTIFWGSAGFIVALILFFLDLSPLTIFPIFAALLVVLVGIFIKKGYYTNTYFVGLLGVNMGMGFLLIYTYFFAPIYTKDVTFYIYSVLFIFLVLLSVYGYVKRWEGPKKFKNEW